MRIFTSTIFILLAIAVGYPQTASKVAILDTSRFDDKAAGIEQLVRAYRSLGSFDTECTFRCGPVKIEADKLRKEIDDLNVKNLPLNSRQDRLQLLDGEYKRMRDSAEIAYKKIEYLEVQPVVNDIRNLVKEFTISRGYLLLVDKAFILYGPVIIEGVDSAPDVTSDFIKFCNEFFAQKESKK